VAAREKNFQTWLYRAVSSLEAGEFTPFNPSDTLSANPPAPKHLTPNSYMWPAIPVPDSADWTTGQKLLGRNGDPQQKQGVALWLFSVTDDMQPSTAFSSLDGETLIVPQAGSLDIQTELGRLLVRQNEIAVIPRSVRYRVTLREGKVARGYVCELFEGHFQLPTLGVIGSTGLANTRDFEVPTAFFEGGAVDVDVDEGKGDGNKKKVVKAARDKEWRIVSRLNGRLWTCTQDHTPFDVVAWHGTSYPYKYDLERFCALGNTRFDHHDPSLFTVLTAPAHGVSYLLDLSVISSISSPYRSRQQKD